MHVKHVWNFHTQRYVKFVWNACEKMCENNVTFHTQNCVKIVWILCEKISLSERDRMCENCVKKGVKKKCVKITSLFTHRYVKIVWNGNFIFSCFRIKNSDIKNMTFRRQHVFIIKENNSKGLLHDTWSRSIRNEKQHLVYRVYMKVLPNELIPNEDLLSREPAKAQQKTKKKEDYACADRDVSRSPFGMSFDLLLYDSGIGSRTGMKVSIRNETRCKLDPEWLHFRSWVM